MEVVNTVEPVKKNKDAVPAKALTSHCEHTLLYTSATEHTDGPVANDKVVSSVNGHDSNEAGMKHADNPTK